MLAIMEHYIAEAEFSQKMLSGTKIMGIAQEFDWQDQFPDVELPSEFDQIHNRCSYFTRFDYRDFGVVSEVMYQHQCPHGPLEQATVGLAGL